MIRLRVGQATPPRDGKTPKEVRVHPGQGDVLSSMARFNVLPAGRRWGKTVVGRVWTLLQIRHNLARGQGGVVWIVTPYYRQARPIWRGLIEITPKGWITGRGGTESHPDFLQFGGRVRLEFRSSDNPAGLVAEGLLALWMDECGIIHERAWKESLRPTLVDHRAPALLTGTPKGMNWYQEMFMRGLRGDPEVRSFSTNEGQGRSSYENTEERGGFLKSSEIDALAKEMPERLRDQEIFAKFLTNSGAVFRDVRQHVSELSKEPTVAVGVDLGRKIDWTTILGVDRNMRPTVWDRFQESSWPVQRARVKHLWLKHGKPQLVVDQSGVGDSFVQDLQHEGIPVEGVVFSAAVKLPLIENLIIGWDQPGVVWIPDDPVWVNEFEAFDHKQLPSGYTRYEAPEGKHDDCVMATALAYRAAMRHADLGISFARRPA